MKWIKELLPYKQYHGNKQFYGFTAGRCEVRVDEEQYSINEYRFLTNKKSFYRFSNLVECRHYNIIGLWIIKMILKYYYHYIYRT